jgi:alpha/beta superfamily hydrolase
MIERGERADLNPIKPFPVIVTILKKHNCKIMERVDVEDVSPFVKWIEWSEISTKEKKSSTHCFFLLDVI